MSWRRVLDKGVEIRGHGICGWYKIEDSGQENETKLPRSGKPDGGDNFVLFSLIFAPVLLHCIGSTDRGVLPNLKCLTPIRCAIITFFITGSCLRVAGS